jgi:SAM-dependent methyltransferase
MTALAHAHGLPVVRADAGALPLRTGSVRAVRCDRVLYHLAEPALALREAARVLGETGRIVCAHPDYESMVLEVPGAPTHLVALTKWTRIALNYTNGTVARKLPKLLFDLGFSNIRTEAFTEVVSDPDAPEYDVPRWLHSWRSQGKIDATDDELRQWDDAIEDARHHGGYLFTLTYLVTYATR